jgi:hypothetical protein
LVWGWQHLELQGQFHASRYETSIVRSLGKTVGSDESTFYPSPWLTPGVSRRFR